jgi:signal transduction histidine kinase/CheY-like chemotaxis protein
MPDDRLNHATVSSPGAEADVRAIPQPGAPGEGADRAQERPGKHHLHQDIVGRQRGLRPYWALIAAAVTLPLLVFAVAAWQNWRDIAAFTAGRAERRAALVAEHALKVFEVNEQVLRRVADRVQGLRLDEIEGSAEVNAFLTALTAEVAHVQGAGLIGPDGRLRAVSGAFPVPQLDLSDRDYYREPLAGDGSTYVAGPTIGRLSGQPFFRLARRRDDPRGAAGVIFISMAPDYFTEFYQATTLGEDAVTMVRADGVVLSREPPVTTGVERLSPRSGLMHGIRQAERGIYRTVSELDGIERIHAYQRVGTYPVYVSYGLSLRVVWREWWGNLATFGAVTALAALALLLLSIHALRRTQGERRLFAQYVAEVQRREESEARLRQAQKMEAVGQLTGGVAHDFNNLLTVITGSLAMLQRRLAEGNARDLRLVDNALEGARRAAALTHRLLAFSRQQPLDPKPLDLNRLVAGMSELLRRTLGEQIEIETVLAGGLWRATADPNELENAILNLAVNARDAMPEGGKLTVETANTALDEAYAASRHEVKPGQYVLISVSDTGAGMPRELLGRVFEPFFTTKPVGKGTGLGLSQVYGFVRQSGGHVAIYSEPGEGTTVKLYLPRYTGPGDSSTAEPARSAPALQSGNGEKILVVEDDPMVRRFTVEALTEAGYRVVEAADGPAGLAALESHADTRLLFTDVVLVGPMNGRRLADAALQRRPDLEVVFTTGYTRNAIIHHGRLDPGVELLGKPFTARELAEKIHAVLHR